jgi:hypothetical protein
MFVQNKKKFSYGLFGLFTFFMVLSFWFFPIIGPKTGLQWADNLFNQLAKNSADSTPLVSIAASTDADLLFKGKDEVLQNKYGLSGKEVIYYWWTAFDDLVRRCIQLNRPAEADFAKFMTTRILEPSYNFAGIESKNISENVGIVAFLLMFYIFYTVWYGFSIMYLFEGFGIGATKVGEKREV